MKILFVCTGNTCRSPMAQVMAEALLSSDFTIASAGIAAGTMPANRHAIAAMKKGKMCLKNHQSQPVTEALLAEAGLVLTMTPEHKQVLIQRFGPSDKIYTMGEFVDCDTVISDPYGGDLETYRRCAEEIYELLCAICYKLEVEK